MQKQNTSHEYNEQNVEMPARFVKDNCHVKDWQMERGWIHVYI